LHYFTHTYSTSDINRTAQRTGQDQTGHYRTGSLTSFHQTGGKRGRDPGWMLHPYRAPIA
jgi:hypothetical protein